MKAMQVAEYMLALNRDAGFGRLDQMKLNKLLYLAQAHSLEATGEPLFTDYIEAFKNGPVIRPVEERFRGAKGGIDFKDSLESIEVDSDKEDLIIDVLAHYQSKSAIALSRMIHQPGNPWSSAYEKGNSTTIKNDDIKEFYSRPENKVLTMTDIIKRMADNVIEVTVDDDGAIVLPQSEYEEA